MKEMKDLVYSRELRLGEILTIGFRLFLENIRTILLGMLVICLPMSILLNLIQNRMVDTNTLMNTILEARAMVSDEEFMQAFRRMLTENFMLVAVSVFLEPIFTIAVAKGVKRRLENRPVSPGKMFGDALLLEGRIVAVGFVYAVLVFLGSMILIPGIIMAVNWCFYIYCIGICDRKGMDALRHSRDLVHGRWWKTLGFLAVLFFTSVFWNYLLQFLFLPFGDSFIVNILYTTATYLTNGFIVCATTVLFLNRESGLFGMADLEEKEQVPTEEEELPKEDENKSE
ncbi:EI24 domain-containing protein [Anaerotignum lactatifermentans]|uniref:EI24 domain-containing protein n=1 Tax=Anaerotignum lactatifermentans TaxID=160404 RepID=A0ABS2G6N1_9FIRM|nr:EI24 domain-containing protein [Anaerotignum lactatifermentans]MBM6828794.1 EI24 domain-containing protein [Anaerotignum lactatifermentans]MBM6877121.1 EI24 domain-containing protein [Anaerotignum lactatifermentans]MBM6950376.1 EI24 domain-containing protein [Anaerotignum lactatifermentans]